MKKKQKYCLLDDGDGHWFICPFEKRKEGGRAIDSIVEYWDVGDFDKECPVLPEWMKQINGPHYLSFENPVEE